MLPHIPPARRARPDAQSFSVPQPPSLLRSLARSLALRSGLAALLALTSLAIFATLLRELRAPLPVLAIRQNAAQNAPANPDPSSDYPRSGETPAQADLASSGCLTCHTGIEHASMHVESTVVLGCTDCHGGNPAIRNADSANTTNSAAYREAERKAHIQPRFAEDAARGGHPVRAYARWIHESLAFVRFANPGDLRVAPFTCGVCHSAETRNVKTSMMTTGAMLWEAALYNNGAYPLKDGRFGESYDLHGQPARVRTFPPPTPEETRTKGILPYLDPLQRWEVSEPGNLLRVFERGGEKRSEIGLPNPDEVPGQPDLKLSDRGLGTELRTDPVFLGIQKTRLLDPILSMPGTNDQPGDYRASGCSACHVLYANDRDPVHGVQTSQYGNNGRSISSDPTIPHQESGHPLQHVFTRSIPSSQCMTCHVHPGTNMETTYYGYTWWDNEADGDAMYPTHQHNPSPQQIHDVQLRNPEGSAPRGNWSDPRFLEQVGLPRTIPRSINSTLHDTQFADFHSHGWVFRAVYKRDRHGHLLDQNGNLLPDSDVSLGKAVHLEDIHLQKGMQCIDCHFTQDVHGNGKLYSETRNAVEIGCTDCHGTIFARAALKTSGPASAGGEASDLRRLRTPFGQARFYWRSGRLYQRSNLTRGLEWEVVQTLDTITPGNPHYSEKSRLAKTLQKDGLTWGDPVDMKRLAHADSSMTCYSCHSSWTTSCFGCHLSMTANQKMPMLHNEGQTTRNYTSYNFMVLRDDVYMLGIDGTVTGHRVAPVRSACAIVVSSQNANRNWLYQQQQPISAPGFSGEAFSTYVPHTVRATETKTCTDCHVSARGDNNAWMAQLLVQGTNFLNFMGKYVYVANGHRGFAAVPIAESSEPPAVLGSDLQRLAWPDNYQRFLQRKRLLRTAYTHGGNNVLDLQLRGEYLYAAVGTGGFRIFDVANVDVKDNSQRVSSAPVSPLGQRFYVRTKYATAVASPSTLALDPLRKQLPQNEEQAIAPLYAFLYVTDKYEGLIVVGDPKTGVGTLLDGNPSNNFLKRAVTFNPDGRLNGARRITLAGTYAYILCDRGMAVVNLADPLHPKITAEIASPILDHPTGVAVQFRYAFVTDHVGLKVFDLTHLDHPRPVGLTVPLDDARNVYVARTFAYVSAGAHGIAIVDVESPEHARLDQTFNAQGALNDVNDLKIGMVSSSQFAFVADGRNGMRIVQLFSPKSTREFYGFSPRPTPQLIATWKSSGPALAISKGVDRDRAVDESGNQLAVFGRRGARPLNAEELARMYLRKGKLYTVTDAPPAPPQSDHATAALANR